MKAIPTSALAVLVLLALAPVTRAEPDGYKPGPDSLPQPGVPQGELVKFEFAASRVFPGTTRQVTVYVPRQYDPAKPACVYVDQDGVQFNAPTVLDNLIARGELPVIIGVFVTPGVVKAQDPATQLNRYNRSLEYDGLGDGYARLLLDEVLPAVETKVTPDGRPIHLSHSGNDRAIAGSSSGAIAAFNAAWERPDQFSRVISAIGTYVSLRGADRFPGLIRKYEQKPIRVFLQDGSSDLNIYGGDWWMANQTMERALTFSGYEVNHVWGDGHHSGNQITAELPNALRWVWKDWPKPVGNGPTQNGAMKALLIPGEGWKMDSHDETVIRSISFNPKGEPYHSERKKLPDDKTGIPRNEPGVLRFFPDGRSMGGSRDFVIAHNGAIYGLAPGKILITRPNGQRDGVASDLVHASGVALSPDQSLLYVADGGSHWVYSYQIQPDGTLANGQRYYWLHSPDSEDSSHAAGMCCDKAGWLYVATALGVQVCDQAGRVNAILPPPTGPVTSVCFGGPRFDTLYATCGDTIYRRRLNATGANPWDVPTLPSVPKL